MEKQIIHLLLSKVRHGAVRVTYWDNTTVTYGESEPELHIIFKSSKAVRAMMKNFNLGFAESYMDGLVEVEGPLDHLVKLVAENRSAFGVAGLNHITYIAASARNIRRNQSAQIQHHYDLGNDFYKLWLDESMTYSCAYFKTRRDSLEKAQEQKVGHILRKLQLQKGQTLLDIGSGWGTLALRAAKEYGVTVLGITLSREQHQHSMAEAKRQGLDDKVRFELVNYQDLAERGDQFDRVVSVGMFEHVGRNNQRQYFGAVDKLLVSGGISVLHTIQGHRDGAGTDPFIQKYIFPGGYIPTIPEITVQLDQHNFFLADYESLRIHYAMTLDEWWRRFEKHKKKVIDKYGERFYRMWRLYLASCSGSFRYGDLDLGQYVFTKGTVNDLPLTRDFLYTDAK